MEVTFVVFRVQDRYICWIIPSGIIFPYSRRLLFLSAIWDFVLIVTITDSLDGFDDLRGFGIKFDFFAQLRNVLVESSAVGDMVEAPGLVKKFISCNRPVFILKKHSQYIDIP